MPGWDDLLGEYQKQPDASRGTWLVDGITAELRKISALRNGRHVLLYGSAFLQKPEISASLITINGEDLNGLMSVIHGMTWTRGLTLVMHTPGGATNATESLVDYLRSKFDAIEVVIPTFAMSAGTMISLAGDRLIMGRQSQLGPIDPQMAAGGRTVSARAVVEQFERATAEVLANTTAAHVWAPILQSLGPSLLQEAQNALDYSEQIVARWLSKYMLSGDRDPQTAGKAVAHHFNDATTHKSHGRRIDRVEARSKGVLVDDLEDNQALQEAVLTAYHLMTILFEQGPLTKMIWADTGRTWLKNHVPSELASQLAGPKAPPTSPTRPAGPPGPPPGARPRNSQRKRNR